MDMTRRDWLERMAAGAALPALGAIGGAEPEKGAAGPMRYVRFERDGRRAYGVVERETVHELAGNPFRGAKPKGPTYPLGEVKLLAPCEPTKILALAGNYKSHLADTPAPKNPELFLKPPSCVLEPEGTIVIPKGRADVHYEGELVIVIGTRAKDVSKAEALSCVFGYTCGNDVSARDWQANDRQWWRAKGSDTFGPVGPWIVAGIDAGDLALTTRLNGEVKQKARTSELIYGAADIVSFASAHVTLLPGDLIFTGTPGTTSAMKPGDRVEVEIERIGVLRNRVA